MVARCWPTFDDCSENEEVCRYRNVIYISHKLERKPGDTFRLEKSIPYETYLTSQFKKNLL